MARLLHKYVIDTDAKRGELKADVKQSYKLLPDMAMDWMLAQVTSVSLSLGSSLRYRLSLSCATCLRAVAAGCSHGLDGLQIGI
jgi:hypothetical protein